MLSKSPPILLLIQPNQSATHIMKPTFASRISCTFIARITPEAKCSSPEGSNPSYAQGLYLVSSSFRRSSWVITSSIGERVSKSMRVSMSIGSKKSVGLLKVITQEDLRKLLETKYR